MGTQGELEYPDYILSSNEDWKLWCRLCAQVDEQGNISVFSNDEPQKSKNKGSGDLNLNAAIKKYFMVNITRKEELPKVVCTECVARITSLVNFTEHVANVQQMFRAIRNGNGKSELDLRSLRLKYDIGDKQQENVLDQKELPEMNCDITSSKVIEMEVDNFKNNETNTNAVNPLEMPLTELGLKNEEEIECDEIYGDENATDYEDNDFLNGEDVEVIEYTQDEISKPSSKTGKHTRVTRNDKINDSKAVMSSGKKIQRDTIPCTKCPLRFKRLKNFQHHMNRIHPDVSDIVCKKYEFRCGECSRLFPTQFRLERHSRTHLPLELTKIIPCEYCNKKFTTDRILQTHIKNVHINDRRFVCEECGVAMQTKDGLKEHMLTHTDYAPFECDICQKGFKNQKRLKRHMEIHDPDKYACPECGLKLSSRGTLNQHLVVHSDEMRHKCDYCGRAFKRGKTLKAHLILHTGLKPYSCNFCDCTFTTGSTCRLHKKKAHPEELAALEAAGGRAYTHNIPKLKALVTITKTVGNLKPVASKPSARLAFDK